jgi:hypothetical protein
MRKILVVDHNNKKVGTWMYDSLPEFRKAQKEGLYDDVVSYQVFEVKVNSKGEMSILRKHPK